jgi:hypothetical protein
MCPESVKVGANGSGYPASEVKCFVLILFIRYSESCFGFLQYSDQLLGKTFKFDHLPPNLLAPLVLIDCHGNLGGGNVECTMQCINVFKLDWER